MRFRPRRDPPPPPLTPLGLFLGFCSLRFYYFSPSIMAVSHRRGGAASGKRAACALAEGAGRDLSTGGG